MPSNNAKLQVLFYSEYSEFSDFSLVSDFSLGLGLGPDFQKNIVALFGTGPRRHKNKNRYTFVIKIGTYTKICCKNRYALDKNSYTCHKNR